jgi:hypothetical protein
MKNISVKLILAVMLIGIFTAGCTKDFADLNKDPNQVNDPDLSQLLTNALYNSAGDEYLQWFYNNSVYFWRFQQITVSLSGTSSDFNQIGALGGVPLYRVMVDMQEIRNRIDKMGDSDKAKYQALRAITFIPQVYLGLRMTDWQGSMVYSEAAQARYTGNITPKYDTQKELFTTWIKELNDAIAVLVTADATQITPGNQDFIYQGEWMKWARFANTIKLRIASRLELADPTWMKSILADVVSKKDDTGNILLITETAQQAIWASGASELGPGGTNSLWVENYAPSQNFSSFLRKNQDPRLGIFFRKNALNDAAIAKLQSTSGVTLPVFATTPVNEPWDRLVGGPVAPDQSGIKDYFGAPLKDADGTVYNRLPYVEYNLIKPKQDNRKGEYENFLLGAPEVCFYLAEFIEKGYVSGLGTAKDWYEKGIRLSCANYNDRATKAQIPDLQNRKISDAQVDALIASSDIQYINGNPGNVEKIILQQIINLFDNPYEGVAVSRRTGYPKRTSAIWAWQPYNAAGLELKLARRFPWSTPTDATNEANWKSALLDQGFTADEIKGELLNQERIWWDKNSPDYGNGN